MNWRSPTAQSKKISGDLSDGKLHPELRRAKAKGSKENPESRDGSA